MFIIPAIPKSSRCHDRDHDHGKDDRLPDMALARFELFHLFPVIGLFAALRDKPVEKDNNDEAPDDRIRAFASLNAEARAVEKAVPCGSCFELENGIF